MKGLFNTVALAFIVLFGLFVTVGFWLMGFHQFLQMIGVAA